MSQVQRPRVGIAVIVLNDEEKMLMHKRKTEHGQGEWAPPGGHLEYKETWVDCALRETIEETGIEISTPEFFAVTNDIFPNGRHYVTIFMRARLTRGTPMVMEPEKAECWEWFPWDDLPTPLFFNIHNLLALGLDPLKD